jgi:uncharacterized RDD family membrane protein YckC
MSDTSQGPGWWQASDGKWYPPETASTPAPAGGAPGASAYGELADWGQRALGILIDWLMIFVIAIVGFIIVAIIGAISSTLGSLIGLLLYLALTVAWLYLGFLVGQKGQSPGMAIMGLRCIGQETGQVIGGGMGVVRTIAHIIDSFICYIGWLFPLWDTQRQTIADKLVKTVVLTNQPKQSFNVGLLKP